jgi:hypothetical protein
MNLPLKHLCLANQLQKHNINKWNKGFAKRNDYSEAVNEILRRNKPIHAFSNKSQEIIYE